MLKQNKIAEGINASLAIILDRESRNFFVLTKFVLILKVNNAPQKVEAAAIIKAAEYPKWVIRFRPTVGPMAWHMACARVK